MESTGLLRGANNSAIETGAGTDEQDDTAVSGDTFDDAGGTAEERGGVFKSDDMDAVADTEDPALVARVPESGCVAEVASRCHKEFEGHIFGRRRVGELFMRLVVL